MNIKLKDIFHIDNLEDYKVHLTIWNNIKHPLDVFLSNSKEWRTWHEYKNNRDWFNRKYIMTFANIYYEKNTWLFTGIYEVLGSTKKQYEIKESNIFKNFKARLKIKFKQPRNPRLNLEGYFNEFEVVEILQKPLEYKVFTKWENVSLSFIELKTIIERQVHSWKSALSNIKGIYVITDKNTGKVYVEKADGEDGIWSRWSCYVKTKHGGNKAFKKLNINEKLNYIEKNFQFTLLECFLKKQDDNYILEREQFWIKAFYSKKHGYNR